MIRFYLVFIIITAIMIPIIYWYFPETKGLSLEEINELFGDEVVVHLTHISDEEKVRLEKEVGIDNKVRGAESEKGAIDVFETSTPTQVEGE